jgi:hypothetical protein
VGGFTLAANSIVRPGTALGDGSGGTVFYFSGSGTASVGADSGKKSPAPFNTTTGGPTGFGVRRPATSALPSNIPATLIGDW